jgi:hypothetical protein
MCTVFLSEYESDQCIQARLTLQSLIELRPTDFTETKRIFKDYFGDYAQSLPAISETETEIDSSETKNNEERVKNDHQRAVTIHSVV